ncbi:MAG: leucine--tRNA ligase, partial [candidate division Zixibacteria bacterium]|nr:leucine--tRNA ligase [candidate division Zixibacteria bacterium]
PFKEIEAKWQSKWEKSKLYKASDDPLKKFYILVMFAYTSGDIHIGHFRNYIIGDVIARYRMMQGYEVLFPFGWDAFGLPAEEAAIKRGEDPERWTLTNIENSRHTLKKTGVSFDWDREVLTCMPDYYKWTQWMFIQFYKNNLAYRGKSLVNWCPHCNTVLANEQVIQGECWRCHSEVTKKELEQWFFKITDYAERLLHDLDSLSGWPENIKIMQRNWIGKSQGVEIDFRIEGTGEKLSVFTTRPDTIYGVTFMAIAPESEILRNLKIESKYKKAVDEYVNKALQKTDIERSSLSGEKDGVFTGRYAINPLSGEKVQLWVAEYVVATYGTGVVMAVPGHDQRDFEFAKKYNIPVKVVIQPEGKNLKPETMEQAYEDPGIMVNSDIFNGLWSTEGIEKINDYVEEKGLGKRKINYKLRDWLISRQRYWGAPIPMIHCNKCGIIPVPESDLPVLLPKENIDFIPKGRSPLADVKEFIQTTCPKCKGKAERDPDTMDTFVCSSWYLFRYTDAHNDKEPFSKNLAEKWMPVDKYIGGIEHATGHLLYFRFFTKVLHDIGWLSVDEPALELFNHGMVLDDKGEIMSKSKGNAVSPLDLMEKNGVDIFRIAVYFAAPSDKEILWTGEGITGARRFLNRIYQFAELCTDNPIKNDFKLNDLSDSDIKTYRKLHQTIKKVESDILTLQMNTAIASMMELVNQLNTVAPEKSQIFPYCIEKFTQILAPFTPHLSEEVWQKLGHQESVFKSKWPRYDTEAILEEKVTVAVQINGKLRHTFDVLLNTEQKEVERIALSDQKVQSHLRDKKILKTIYVPNKILNIVVK